MDDKQMEENLAEAVGQVLTEEQTLDLNPKPASFYMKFVDEFRDDGEKREPVSTPRLEETLGDLRNQIAEDWADRRKVEAMINEVMENRPEGVDTTLLGAIWIHPGYGELYNVLTAALEQAQAGKGRERHANGKPFMRQPIMEIGRMVGLGYQTGQAMKKTQEAGGMYARNEHGRAIAELLGAINYLAAAVILIEENIPYTPVVMNPTTQETDDVRHPPSAV